MDMTALVGRHIHTYAQIVFQRSAAIIGGMHYALAHEERQRTGYGRLVNCAQQTHKIAHGHHLPAPAHGPEHKQTHCRWLHVAALHDINEILIATHYVCKSNLNRLINKIIRVFYANKKHTGQHPHDRRRKRKRLPTRCAATVTLFMNTYVLQSARTPAILPPGISRHPHQLFSDAA